MRCEAQASESSEQSRCLPAPLGSEAVELSSDGFSDELAPKVGMP